ncbi:hypothetical protein ERJ75_000298400 [Trypanosoma vivax]|nr:hypothetical protein ERJ75_000298400 [Trypanosoma vivax]
MSHKEPEEYGAALRIGVSAPNVGQAALETGRSSGVHVASYAPEAQANGREVPRMFVERDPGHKAAGPQRSTTTGTSLPSDHSIRRCFRKAHCPRMRLAGQLLSATRIAK